MATIGSRPTIKVKVSETGGLSTTSSPVTLKNVLAPDRLDRLTDVNATNEVNNAVPVYDANTDTYVVRELNFGDLGSANGFNIDYSNTNVNQVVSYAGDANTFVNKPLIGTANEIAVSANNTALVVGIPDNVTLVNAAIGTIDRNPVVDVVLTGDVTGTGNATLTNLGNATITINTTASFNSIELGVDTTGQYVANVANGVGIFLSNTGGESSVPVFSIGQDVSNNMAVAFFSTALEYAVTVGANTVVNTSTIAIGNSTSNTTITGSGITTTTLNLSNVVVSSALTANQISITGPNGTGATLTSPANDITQWVYTGKTFSVAGQETAGTGLFFKPDGTKMYVVGSTGDDINEYNLSTPWDISTAVFLQVSANIGEGTPQDITFNPDGTKLYVIGDTNDAIREYDLSTAWDVSTITFVQTFSVATQDTGAQGLFFKPDGLKLYITGASSDSVHEYNLSTAWNISTATFSQTLSVSTQETGPSGVVFNTAGTRMFVVGVSGDDINEYALSSAWNISTAVFVGKVFVAFGELTPNGIYYNETQNKVWVIGSSGDAIDEYSTNTAGLSLVSNGGIYIKGSTTFANNIFLDGELRSYSNVEIQGSTSLSTTTVGATLAATSTVSLTGATNSVTSIGTAASTGSTTIGGTAMTGLITVGQSTVTSNVNIATGATNSTATKVVNMGTGGVSGSITNIQIGSNTAGALGNVNIWSNNLLVGANVIVNPSSITIGNSTVNAVRTSTYLQIANSTSTANLTSALLSVGNSTVNAVHTSTYLQVANSTATSNLTPLSLNIGANVIANSTAVFTGNSTANAIHTQGFVSVSNSTVTSNLQPGAVNVGANTVVNTTTIFLGNSTVNAVETSTYLQIANSTTAANLTPGLLSIGNSTVNATHSTSVIQVANSTITSNLQLGSLNIGANASVNTTAVYIGNSTANAVHAQGFIQVANSTVTSNLAVGSLNIGANVVANTTAVYTGNSTANAVHAQGYVSVSNSTITSNITPGSVSVGANVIANATNILIGNTSVYNSANSTTTVFGSDSNSGIGFFQSFANYFISMKAFGATQAGRLDATSDYNMYFQMNGGTNRGFVFRTGSNPVAQIDASGNIYANGSIYVGNSSVNTTINPSGISTVGTLSIGNTTINGTLGSGNTTITGWANVSGNVTATNIRTTGGVQIDGDLTVSGNTITIGVTNLNVTDNMIYLNEAESATVTSVTSNGTAYIYTANNTFSAGMVVTVTGVNPSGYNVTANTIVVANATHFTVANTSAPGAYVSGGSASGKSAANPDLGFSGAYDDGTYRHAGFFRDATDGVFKVFDQYVPEPSGAFINTSNNTFRIADFQSNNSVFGTANVAGTTRLGVGQANYLQLVGNSTTNAPNITAQGTDTDIGVVLSSKGAGRFGFFTNNLSNEQFRIAHTASAVNYLQATGGATGSRPYILAAGADANVGITIATKGTGTHQFWTAGGTTLQFEISHADSAVNYARIVGAAATGGPTLLWTGSDASVVGVYNTKGAGAHYFATNNNQQFRINDTASAVNYLAVTGGATGSRVNINGTGSDTDVGINYTTKGAGTHAFNTGAGSAAQFAITHTASAVNYLNVSGGAAGSGAYLAAVGNDTNVSMDVRTKGTGSFEVSTGGVYAPQFRVAHTASAVNYVSVTGAATGLHPSISATGTDTDVRLNIFSKGAASVDILTAGGGTRQARFVHVTSAVNYVQIQGAVTGSGATITSQGTDANVDIIVNAKGDSSARLRVSDVTKLQVSNTTVSVTGNTSLSLGAFNGEGGELGFANSTGGSGPIVDVDGGNDWRFNTYNNASNYKFNTGASPTTAVMIAANSFVGFGTTAPAYKIDVYTNSNTVSSAVRAVNANTDITASAQLIATQGTTSFAQYVLGGTAYFGTTTNSSWYLVSNNTIKGILAANGNFGIGNSVPTTLLSVGGTSNFQGNVSSNGFVIDTTLARVGVNKALGALSHTLTMATNYDGDGIQIAPPSGQNYGVGLKFANNSGSTLSTIGGVNNSGNFTPGTAVGDVVILPGNNLLIANASVTRVAFVANGNVGIGNTTPTDKLRVEGTLSHTGLSMSTGTNVDQIYTATPSITLSTAWQSTGVTSTNLANGTYIVQLFANDVAAGGTANNEYYSGMMSWYSADTNSTVLDEIPLHRTGINGSNNAIFLATQRTATANTSDLILMIASSANNSSASTYTIKLRRMI